mmetsp:Transcript_36535/g.91598  ORF Transcript_36535/g.91598 Transcript_36535/m.91598 type:complete len:642 (-) Transcript_36535:279-2204(-)
MAEVDEIILHSLSAIGCDVDELKNIQQLTPETLFRAVVLCLRAIDSSRQYSELIPPNMSTRVSVCSDIASWIKDLGYRGDINYHHLLYPNASDPRKILTFLFEMLPKDERSAMESASVCELTDSAITEEFRRIVKETWISPEFQSVRYADVTLFHADPIHPPFIPPPISSKDKPTEEYFRLHMDFVARQPHHADDIVPSLLQRHVSSIARAQEKENDWNANGLDSGLNPFDYKRRKKAKIMRQMAGCLGQALTQAPFAPSTQTPRKHAPVRLVEPSRFQSTLLFTEPRKDAKPLLDTLQGDAASQQQVDAASQQQGDTASQQRAVVDLSAQREMEIMRLDEEISGLDKSMDHLHTEIETQTSFLYQLEANIVSESERRVALNDELRVKKKALELLPDAENNIKALEGVTTHSITRLKDLAKEWEQHRQPLLTKYKELKEAFAKRKEGAEKKLDEIRVMRTRMREIADETKKRDDRYHQLVEVYNRMPKNINRSVYTRRILDIVKNVKKQKVDIDKILIDTRTLQKEINAISEALGRSFAVTSEVIFNDALKEPTAKQAYKDLAATHEKFKSLSEQIEETGSTRNAILDLEEKMEQVSARIESLNLERITADLDQIQQENVELQQQLGKRGQDALDRHFNKK